MIRAVYGSNKGGVAYFTFRNSSYISFFQSFRSLNHKILIDKLDGSPKIIQYMDSVLIDFTISGGFSTVFSYASITSSTFSCFYTKGIKDLYSLYFIGGTSWDIQDIETFFKQFSNLYSVRFYFSIVYTDYEKPIVKGDLSRFPDSVERVYAEAICSVNVNNDLVLNFSNYSPTSKLKWFNGNIDYKYGGSFKMEGNLAMLPMHCEFLYLSYYVGGIITYSGTKVWASNFDTIVLPVALGTLENNKILSDMRLSVLSSKGGRLISLLGTRDPSSDSDVAYLESLGFSVLISRQSYIQPIIPPFRYIKDSLQGNNLNGGCYWVEIQVFNEGENVALNKGVALYRANGTFVKNSALVTDGNTSSSSYLEGGSGSDYVILDLGSIFSEDSIINIRHYNEDGRKFNTQLEVSDDGVVWTTLYDSSFMGVYAEIASGKEYKN